MNKTPLRKLNLSEFRAHMGQYLRQVREGNELVLYDRNTPVTILKPYVHNVGGLKIRKATMSPQDLILSPPVPGRKSHSLWALEEERRDRF